MHLQDIQKEAYATAKEKGWWDKPRSDIECIALAITELAEAIEALRHDNPPDDKIPQFKGAEAEIADCFIRLLDLAGHREWDVAGALEAKLAFNKGREYRHGKVL